MEERDAWTRPARLGGLWAGSEIVLGSFLHNLRLPLRGHVMTAVSAVLLSAAHARHPRRGLLWRAGLVCAALKSVSPSAVLLGPMVAISAEGFLMEAGTRLLAGSAGRVLGGGLAMAWIPVHLTGRAAILYGLDAARLYQAAWDRASAPLGLTAVGPWGLLGLVWALHFLAGAAAVALLPAFRRRSSKSEGGGAFPRPAAIAAPAPRFAPSWSALAANVGALLVGLRVVKSASTAGAVAFTAAAVAIWFWLYPGVESRLRRPGLWIGLFAVALSAGALLGVGGLEAGLRMALRAGFLSAAFAALSQELAAPLVRSRLAAWGAGGWLAAVEGAFASLPALVARLPPAGDMLRRPGDAFAALLAAAEPPALFLVTGASGAGKTTFLSALVEELQARGRRVAGVLSPGEHEGGVRSGFDVVDLANGRRAPLCRRGGPPHWPALAGPFHFSPEGLALGRDALSLPADVLVVDEVGPLELSGGGWAPALDAAALDRREPMVWAVRESLVDAVQARWSAPALAVWTPATDPAVAAAALEAAR